MSDSVKTDVMTPSQRSRCMSRIRGKDTEPELKLRRFLWKKGLRYRLPYNLKYKIFGKPDLVFYSKKVAVFVDGCFWHSCPEHGAKPKNRSSFWRKKLERNITRDREVSEYLTQEGWLVLRFWEHEVAENIEEIAQIVEKAVKDRK
jgi:DNA mismatch endonuclease (patch repair protein)